MTDVNELVEIASKDWPELRSLYKLEWPKHLLGYYTVDNYIKWIKKLPKIKNLTFWSLNGDWRSDGTFIVVDRYQLLINSLDDRGSRLELALALLVWSKGFKVSSYMARNHNAVLNVIKSKQLEIEYDSPVELYHLAKERAELLDLNPPDGITLRPLGIANAELVNDVWPNKHIASLFFVKRVINLNTNIGAFTADGELVSMCLRLQCGALGALQTVKSHQRRGLATVVTIAMVKQLADLGMDTFALVGPHNFSSKRTFDKMGFTVIDNTFFTRTEPIQRPFVWHDDSDEE